MAGYGVDTNWYMDTCATDHITGELEKLTTREKYHGGDQVHTASGSGMEIQHFGHGILRSPTRDLHLRNILHVPSTNKDLLSVNRIANDNNVFFEFHPDHFCVKDQETRKVLLTGLCKNGLYPVKSSNKKSAWCNQADYLLAASSVRASCIAYRPVCAQSPQASLHQ
jgi:histone deacetylase 1/2